jgi:glycosyltransferase involved in cell wall biosynthesis
MTQPLISVVIPTYEMKGQGLVFLIRALESINRQTGIDPTELEIVISDQSDDKVIA